MRSHRAMNPFRRRALCGALFVAIGICGAVSYAHAQGAPVRKIFDVSEQPAASALNAFAEQADITLVFSQDLVQGITTHPLRGSYTAPDGLRTMLEGTGLSIQEINGTTISIGDGSHPGEASRVDMTLQQEAAKTLASVTVTGTRIRGGTTPSPVITIGSEQIKQEGYTDLGEVIRNVPQNFNGGQNPGVVGVFAGGVGDQNFTGGSALNLRGLGADASLTLLNGRRLAYDGFSQAVDISAIPVEAVERLDIIPDGASAIYGSDAVGGVANVILKPDYDGVAVGARYGGSADGGLATREYTATAGTTWTSGGLIATFKNTDVDPIYADQRGYARHLFDPYTIYGGGNSRSGLVSIHQSLGDVAELKLDALRSKRDMTSYAAAQADAYYHYSPENSIMLVSPSIIFNFRNDWSLTLSGAYGTDDNVFVRRFVSSAGSSLNLLEYTDNKSRSYEIGAEGPLFPVGEGDARLALGAGTRKYGFHDVQKVSGSSFGGDESVRFAYAELDLPFISPSSGIAGAHRLEFSAAIRGEDYDSFGRVATPKLGVIYDPTADFTFKASWGKSFKAPTLLQRYQSGDAYLWSTAAVGAGDLPAGTTALMSYGGNANLDAERARTWTTSLAFHPEAWPGLDAELTWFDIDYTDRVVEPVNYQQALSNPAYKDFVVWSPTPGQVQDLLAVYNNAFYNLSGAAYDPGKVVAIIHDHYVNAARQRIKGLDLSGSYRFDLGDSGLVVRGSASWLDSVQTTSAGQSEQKLAGTVANPARLNGRVGAVWTSKGFSASGFVNYTSGVSNRFAPVPENTASFTTLDTTISYNTGERADAFSGMTLELSVQNLLNRAPPLYTTTFVPYDATNYSAIGRFASVSVSKRW